MNLSIAAGRISARCLYSVSDLDGDEIELVFDEASRERNNRACLSGRTLINFFFEESTRTRLSFEIAAKSMGADVINVQGNASSMRKGESFRDSIETVLQYNPDYIAIRHPESGIFRSLEGMDLGNTKIINAGDGKREHPTQALGDALTIIRSKGTVKDLVVVLCGDIKNSRVAKSNIALLERLGAKLRIVTSPISMLNEQAIGGVPVYFNLEEGVKDADVIMSMRYKREYNTDQDEQKFFRDYQITYKCLRHAKENVIVMHPGPVMRNIDVEAGLCDDKKYSVITDQVRNCMLIRGAILRLFTQ